MFRTILIVLLYLSFSAKSQIFRTQEQPKINQNFQHTFIKKQNLISYKASNFKFTLKANLNGGAIQNSFQNNSISNSNLVGYDFRTKYYLTKRVHLVLKTKFSGTSAIASFGIYYILEKK